MPGPENGTQYTVEEISAIVDEAHKKGVKVAMHATAFELQVYDLVIAKGGLKMKEARQDEKPIERMSNGSLTVRAMPIEVLLIILETDGRLIVDKTGLGDKKFDFDLQWTPNFDSELNSGPSWFTALEEQLGLNLMSSKAPEKVLVIDHMKKPSPN